MPTFTTTIDIQATPDDVWAVLSDTPATRQWLPGVSPPKWTATRGSARWPTAASPREDQRQLGRGAQLPVRACPRPTVGAALRRIFTVTAGPGPDTATVTPRTTFEPLDPTGPNELTGMIERAFQQSLESLRRFVENKLPWDVS